MPIHNQYSQDYDKILKENAEAMILPLAHKVLNLAIMGFEPIPNNLQRTIEREPDFLKIVLNEQGKRLYILHMEFQVANEPKMVYRMLEYSAFLIRKYELPVKQFVFYIGQETPTMNSKYRDSRHKFRFRLLNIKNFSYKKFLDSNKPEEIILSILANFAGDLPEQIIHQVLHKLKDLVTEKISLERYFTQLEILSKLRNLQPQTVKQINAMPLVYDLQTDLRYLQGVEDAQKASSKILQKVIEAAQESERAAQEAERVAQEAERVAQESEKARKKAIKKALLRGKLTIQEIAEDADVSIEFVLILQRELEIEGL